MSYQHQPLGTVIASLLNYDQLCTILGEQKGVDNKKSSYAPCDGRSIVESTLEKMTRVSATQPDPEHHIQAAPDLRGKFLRGLNQMYSVGEPQIDFTRADPDGQGRKVGDYQTDMLGSHAHSAASSAGIAHAQSYGMGIQSNSGQQVDFIAPSISVDKTGGPETRPRNVAVYYYIKIN